jgi:hypothetical protein
MGFAFAYHRKVSSVLYGIAPRRERRGRDQRSCGHRVSWAGDVLVAETFCARNV